MLTRRTEKIRAIHAKKIEEVAAMQTASAKITNMMIRNDMEARAEDMRDAVWDETVQHSIISGCPDMMLRLYDPRNTRYWKHLDTLTEENMHASMDVEIEKIREKVRTEVFGDIAL